MISVILAAGKGTRMKSGHSKVLHKVNGVPMIRRVVDVLESIGNKKNVFVLGYKKEDVLAEMGDVDFVTQEEQLGTGHAILIAKDKIKSYGEDVLITCGDTPLLKEETLKKLKDMFDGKNLDCIVLSCKVKNPFGYGRIVKENGKISNIVEEKEANESEKKIDEINTGVYIFKNESLLYAIEKIDNNNSKGEYYLTDAIKILTSEGYNVDSFQIEDEDEILGVNSKVQLAQAEKILRNRKNTELMDNGVILIDPDATYIEDNVQIGQDTVIYPNVIIQGNTKIGKNCKIGDFVEVKNSIVEDGSKASHLTYIGDAEVGKNVNLGCGVVFVNYDGVKKQKVVVEDNAFIGCNCNLVAPVKVGANSYVAAGSTVTKKVDPETLFVARSKGVVKRNWKLKNRSNVKK